MASIISTLAQNTEKDYRYFRAIMKFKILILITVLGMGAFSYSMYQQLQKKRALANEIEAMLDDIDFSDLNTLDADTLTEEVEEILPETASKKELAPPLKKRVPLKKRAPRRTAPVAKPQKLPAVVQKKKKHALPPSNDGPWKNSTKTQKKKKATAKPTSKKKNKTVWQGAPKEKNILPAAQKKNTRTRPKALPIRGSKKPTKARNTKKKPKGSTKKSSPWSSTGSPPSPPTDQKKRWK